MVGTVENPEVAGKVIQGRWYTNSKLHDVGMEVLRRDRFTCSNCGFHSRPSKQVPHGYMVPIDVTHPGFVTFRAETSRCMCPLCASSMAINWSVVEHKADHAEIKPVAGSLIWLPEVDQQKICLVATFTLVGVNAYDVGHELADTLSHADISFRGRKAHLSSNLPLYKEDRDSDFARALALLPSEYHMFSNEVLAGVRFWPNTSFWVEQSKYWRHSTYRQMEEESESSHRD